MKAHAVRRALYQIECAVLLRGVQGRVYAEQRLAFFVEKRLPAVEILEFRFAVHPSGGKANDLVPAVTDGNDDTVEEEVISCLIDKSKRLQDAVVVFPRREKAASWSIAYAYLITVFLSPTAIGIVLCLGRLQKSLSVVLADQLIAGMHIFLLQSDVTLMLCLLPFAHLNIILSGKMKNGLAKGHVLMLHDKVYDTAVLSTAKAVEMVRIDIERGGSVPMKGASADHVGARLFELDPLTDIVSRTYSFYDFFNCLLRYHE